MKPNLNLTHKQPLSHSSQLFALPSTLVNSSRSFHNSSSHSKSINFPNNNKECVKLNRCLGNAGVTHHFTPLNASLASFVLPAFVRSTTRKKESDQQDKEDKDYKDYQEDAYTYDVKTQSFRKESAGEKSDAYDKNKARKSDSSPPPVGNEGRSKKGDRDEHTRDTGSNTARDDQYDHRHDNQGRPRKDDTEHTRATGSNTARDDQYDHRHDNQGRPRKEDSEHTRATGSNTARDDQYDHRHDNRGRPKKDDSEHTRANKHEQDNIRYSDSSTPPPVTASEDQYDHRHDNRGRPRKDDTEHTRATGSNTARDDQYDHRHDNQGRPKKDDKDERTRATGSNATRDDQYDHRHDNQGRPRKDDSEHTRANKQEHTDNIRYSDSSTPPPVTASEDQYDHRHDNKGRSKKNETHNATATMNDNQFVNSNDLPVSSHTGAKGRSKRSEKRDASTGRSGEDTNVLHQIEQKDPEVIDRIIDRHVTETPSGRRRLKHGTDREDLEIAKNIAAEVSHVQRVDDEDSSRRNNENLVKQRSK